MGLHNSGLWRFTKDRVFQALLDSFAMPLWGWDHPHFNDMAMET